MELKEWINIKGIHIFMFSSTEYIFASIEYTFIYKILQEVNILLIMVMWDYKGQMSNSLFNKTNLFTKYIK